MSNRLPITKTYKLFIGGKFPRSESGRSLKITGPGGAVLAHTCHASRKDLREAVEAASGALAGWSGASAYLRGQILYRLAEMLEGKRTELARAITEPSGATEKDALTEIDASIDRVIAFAGWTDKLAHILGCANPVSGPYHNFSVPEPTGVVGAIAPDAPPLLGLISLIAPALSVGGTVVALASRSNPIPACMLAEALATSDLPGGTVNILTGELPELVGQFASHREIGAVLAGGVGPEDRRTLREGAAENLKRVTVLPEGVDWSNARIFEGADLLEALVEIKTFWHPSAT